MSKALYRKYRSKALGEIVGQEHVTNVLKKALEQGRIAHAYLLTGPRGVGKTSIARILAHEINQLPYSEDSQHLDIIEIDAASNNGVEDVRDLRDKIQITPVSARKKIYIIDEVHMLSKAAFNALLKTLEEPPEYVVFILATTDIEKLPPTIISRTQRFSFRSIAATDAKKHLAHIAKEEKISIDDDALELIAQRGDGSFRDSISLLDQLSSLAGKGETITRSLVEESLGLAAEEEVAKLLDAFEAKDLSAIVKLLNDTEAGGVQPIILTNQLMQMVRTRLIEKPQLLSLLDLLLEVPKSSQPNIKLLTALATGTRPKNVGLEAPSLSISASVEELRKPKHDKPRLTTATNKDAVADAPKLTPDISPPKEAQTLQPRSKEKKTPIDFDWTSLLNYTKQHYIAIHSVLSKCSPEFDGQTLTLYTVNAFYKKKLDDTKYRVILTKSLIEIGVGELAIETIPTPSPPKDSVAASVAAIMGGGEEVSMGQESTSVA